METNNYKMKQKDLLYIILPVIVQSILYFLTKFIHGNIHLLVSPFDQRIPFISYFVYPYIAWYLMLIIVPFIIFKYDKYSFKKYNKLFIICSIFCILVFIIYPTTIIREEITIKNLSTYLVSIVYKLDTPVLNCFPSLHSLNSMMWIAFFIKNKKIPIVTRILIIILSFSIILATLFIKQHVIYDLIGSLFVLLIGYVIINIRIKKENT